MSHSLITCSNQFWSTLKASKNKFWSIFEPMVASKTKTGPKFIFRYFQSGPKLILNTWSENDSLIYIESKVDQNLFRMHIQHVTKVSFTHFSGPKFKPPRNLSENETIHSWTESVTLHPRFALVLRQPSSADGRPRPTMPDRHIHTVCNILLNCFYLEKQPLWSFSNDRRINYTKNRNDAFELLNFFA